IFLEQLEIARAIERKDLEIRALYGLSSSVYFKRLELDRAAPLIERASELVAETGSVLGQGWVLRARAKSALLRGEFEEAEVLVGTELRLFSLEPLEALIQFLRERGRDEEAAPFARRLLELSPVAGLASSFEASAARIA